MTIRRGTITVLLILSTIVPLSLSAEALFTDEALEAPAPGIERDAVEAYLEAREHARAYRFSQAEESAERALSIADTAIENGDASGLIVILKAHIYLELIYDASSWSRFNGELTDTVYRMREIGVPEADIDFVEAKRLMLFPPEAGGDLERSLELFSALADEKTLLELAVFHAAALTAADRGGEALVVLRDAHQAAPGDAAVADALAAREIETAGPTITEIRYADEYRTRATSLDSALRIAVGSRLTENDAASSVAGLIELPTVVNAGLVYHYDHYDHSADTVEIEVAIREAADRSLTVALSTGIHAGPQAENWIYTDETEFPLPVLIYTDTNLFGRGAELTAVTAGVYNQVFLATSSGTRTGPRLHLGAQGLIIPEQYLEFYDEARRPLDELEIRSSWAAGSIGVGYTLPAGVVADLSYTVRKDWYRDAEDTADAMELPDDLLHSVRAETGMEFLAQTGPGGIVPVGIALTLGAEYDYYQEYDRWGIPEETHDAPSNGLGTTTYDIAMMYGTRLSDRVDASVSLAYAGGTNYYTRTYHRLGAGDALNGSAVYLRGYRTDEFYAEHAFNAHIGTGYEIVPGKAHIGVFSDAALVKPAPFTIDDADRFRPLVSAGTTASALLPWKIRGQIEVAHGFLDLEGELDHSHTTVALRLIRTFDL